MSRIRPTRPALLSTLSLSFSLLVPLAALAQQPAADLPPEPAPEAPAAPPPAPEGAPPAAEGLPAEPAQPPPPEGEAAAAAEEPAPGADETAPPASRLALPTFTGPVGLFRLSSAETGGVGQLRLGLHGEYASKDNFLVNGDRDKRFGGSLALGVTPVRQLEIFAAIMASANRNDRVCTVTAAGERCVSERGRVDPPIIRSFGDLVLGAKLASKVTGPLHAGFEAGVRLFAANDGLLIASDATSFWFNGLGTVDFRESGAALPLRVHANLGYYLDNSEKVQDFSGFMPGMIGSKAVSIFAYGINRDRFRIALGLDAPLDKLGGGKFALLPLFEYHAEIITADADPAFAAFMAPLCGSAETPCSENRDQHWVTVGLRGQAPGGFTVDLGFDVALKSPGFPYGPALLPFNFEFGVAFPFDFSRSKIVTKTVTVDKPVLAAPQEGFVSGKVVGAKGEPIGGAIVSVAGHSNARVATDPDGSFTTKGLAAGTVDLEIAAPDFEPQLVKANVALGQTAAIAATLHPRENKNRIHGRVTDPSGKALAGATLRITGPTSATLTTDAEGLFTAELTPGAYVARAESGKLAKEEKFELQVGVDRTLDISFGKGAVAKGLTTAAAGAPAGGPAPVAVVKNRLVVRRPVGFKTPDGNPSANLLPSSQQTLDVMAEVLSTHPEIKTVRVEAHWDNGLPKAEADELTQKQADAIASYLGKKGVDAARVQAVGMGASKPRVPNFGPASRAKNRRVEFSSE